MKQAFDILPQKVMGHMVLLQVLIFNKLPLIDFIA